MAETMNESVIEWVRGDKTVTITAYSNSRLNTKLRKYAETNPAECQIIHENEDGSLMAHVPLKWVKVAPPRRVSDEQRKASSERLRGYLNGKRNTE